MVLQHKEKMVLQGGDKMKIEENEAINNDPIDENPIDKTNVRTEVKLLSLELKIEEKQEELKKMEDLYDIYNNLLENMTNLYVYKITELNDLLRELKVTTRMRVDQEIELNSLNRLIEKRKSELKEIEELKANSLNLPYF